MRLHYVQIFAVLRMIYVLSGLEEQAGAGQVHCSSSDDDCYTPGEINDNHDQSQAVITSCRGVIG